MKSEQDAHISIEALWKYRGEMVPLSPDQLQHLYYCDGCLTLLGICQCSNSLAEANRLREGKPRAGEISD
jgi:hypothetical protein